MCQSTRTSPKLFTESEAVKRFLSEAEVLVGQVNQFKRQRKEVEQTKQKFALQRLEIERATQEEENQKRLVARALSNIDEGRWTEINLSELKDAAPFRSLLNAVQEGLTSHERLPLLHQAILTLNDVSGEGAVSEEVERSERRWIRPQKNVILKPHQSCRSNSNSSRRLNVRKVTHNGRMTRATWPGSATNSTIKT